MSYLYLFLFCFSLGGENSFFKIERGINSMHFEEECVFGLFNTEEVENIIKKKYRGSMFGIIKERPPTITHVNYTKEENHKHKHNHKTHHHHHHHHHHKELKDSMKEDENHFEPVTQSLFAQQDDSTQEDNINSTTPNKYKTKYGSRFKPKKKVKPPSPFPFEKDHMNINLNLNLNFKHEKPVLTVEEGVENIPEGMMVKQDTEKDEKMISTKSQQDLDHHYKKHEKEGEDDEVRHHHKKKNKKEDKKE
jgi:hypothetical protein